MWDVHWIVARVKQEKGIVLFGFLFIILWLKYEKTEIKFSRKCWDTASIQHIEYFNLHTFLWKLPKSFEGNI